MVFVMTNPFFLFAFKQILLYNKSWIYKILSGEDFMKKGKLIVIEGACDAIGKTTQFELLSKHLQEDGYEIMNHHFPTYDSYHGAPVEHYLAGDIGNPREVEPYFANSLYAVDRAVAWKTKLKPFYDQGGVVLLDRYTTSSLIYQSALFEDIEEKKKFLDFVEDFEYKKLGIQKPDTVIFLHAPFELAQRLKRERQQNDGIQNDIHERDPEYMKKVYESGMFCADYLSWDKIQCNDGDQMRSREDIHEEIYQLVKRKK